MARPKPGQPPHQPAGPGPDPGPAGKLPRRNPPTEAERAFGARLREARINAGWTSQTEAAKELGVPPSRLAEYESGRIMPPVLRLVEIVDRLGLDPSILFPHWWSRKNP